MSLVNKRTVSANTGPTDESNAAIELYDYWRSSASYRVRIALGLSGEKWRGHAVNLLEEDQKSNAHLARNPQGLVPVLEIDGYNLTQSLAQIEYLDETRQLGLLPGTAFERAKVRALSYVIAMEIHPICNLNVAKWAVAQSGQKLTMERWISHFIIRGLEAYEAMITDSDYSYGEGVTMADICLMPQLYNAHRWGVDLVQFPKISHIQTVLQNIPAFQAAHPDATLKA